MNNMLDVVLVYFLTMLQSSANQTITSALCT